DAATFRALQGRRTPDLPSEPRSTSAKAKRAQNAATGARRRVPGVAEGSDATGTGSTDAERARMAAARPLVEASGIACPLAADDHAAAIGEDLAAGPSRAAARVGRRILLSARVLDTYPLIMRLCHPGSSRGRALGGGGWGGPSGAAREPPPCRI